MARPHVYHAQTSNTLKYTYSTLYPTAIYMIVHCYGNALLLRYALNVTGYNTPFREGGYAITYTPTKNKNVRVLTYAVLLVRLTYVCTDYAVHYFNTYISLQGIL